MYKLRFVNECGGYWLVERSEDSLHFFVHTDYQSAVWRLNRLNAG